jgi:HD-GYP domain-containing protein (c-di-GMP phosphodiesterase class II)
MKITLSKEVLLHILRNPFLKFILFVFLLISLTLFFVQQEIVFPVFQKMQKDGIESEAARTAQHLQYVLHIDKEPKASAFSIDLKRDVQHIMQNFELIKLKIFNAEGKVIFSTEAQEIDEINKHDYFHEHVAKGRIFSKIVEENHTSMEGKFLPVSVAEVYIPIYDGTHFYGAFEIYYNITEQNRKIVRNEFIFKIASFSTWLILFIIFTTLLLKASRANILTTLAERRLTDTNHWLEDTVVEKTREIKATQIISVQALAILAEHYDPDTGRHLTRIQLYVRTLLEYLAISDNPYKDYVHQHPNYIEEIVFACLLHDIGKTAIPVEILMKPAKLSPEEFEIVKEHTTIAGEALDAANVIFRKEFNKDSYLALARDISIYHHEKWNGEGYPHRLKGNDIPLSARIVAIADVYDALTCERPYKKSWPHEQAYTEILKGSGSHFDPSLVEAFQQCSEEFKRIACDLHSHRDNI